jgi:hypothetical protein
MSQRNAAYHLGWLYAWPLVSLTRSATHPGASGSSAASSTYAPNPQNERTIPIPRLDFESEEATLHTVLDQACGAATSPVTIRREVATRSNLRSFATLGCRALHYSGHGLQVRGSESGGMGEVGVCGGSDVLFSSIPHYRTSY